MGIWRRGTGMIVATGLSRKARERFFIFAARRSGVRCDCRVGGRPATASLAFERGAAAVALDVHFRRWWRDERGGRRPRPSLPGHRISQSATVSDRLIVRVCVTDPRHALFGQRFDLSPSSEPRPGWVSVLLADGRRRGLPRAATDLDLACETMPNHALPRVSVRTLLPLARYVEALLWNWSQTADVTPPSHDPANFASGSWGPAAGTGAEAVAEDDGGATTRSGTADRPLAAIEAGGRATAKRGGSC